MRKIGIKSQQDYKLDLGCGKNKKEDCIGIDDDNYGQEIIWDITEGIPFPDNSIIYINMGNFIEHITEEDIPWLFVDILRICKSGAIVDITTPHSDSIEAYRMGHVSYWNENRMKGITQSFDSNFTIVEMYRQVFKGRENAPKNELVVKFKVVK